MYLLLLSALLPALYLLKSFLLSPAYPGLRLPPGPWQLPIIGSLHQLRGGLLHQVLRDLSRKYGPVMFLKVGEVPLVVISSREAAREVMKTKDAIFATRPQTPTIKLLAKGSPGMILAPYGKQWRQFRKICVLELLSARHVQSFRHVREDEAARLVAMVAAASSAPPGLINLNELLTAHVLDVSVRCIMGDRFRERDTFLRELARDMKTLGEFGVMDIFPSLAPVVRVLSSTPREAERHHGVVLKLMDAILEEHRVKRSHTGNERAEDFMDVLLRIQREEGVLSTGAVKGLIHDLFSAGGETASVTLLWAMAELMKNPEVIVKAQDEVRTAFSPETKVTEGLAELTYLRCVVSETLRLHPAGALLLPRECREQCRVLGYDVPKGAMVLVNAWAIARNVEYWEDPETFRPERFQGAKVDFRGNDFEFIPFGSGRRICPGISFALAGIELALANLLFYFDWSLPDGVTSVDLDMTETEGLTTRRKDPLYLKATPCMPLPSS